MGGGISITSYNEKLTKEDIKEICGGILNEPLFNCVKNDSNDSNDNNETVDRDKFFKIALDSIEQEILFLYFHFTKNKMILEQFIQFCVHGRLLTKNTFRRKDAELLFQQFAINNTINYMQLRFDIFPEMAIKKGIDLQTLLIKLSRLNPPNYQEKDSKFENNENDINNTELKIRNLISSQSSTTTKDDPSRNNAAIKIQKIQRTWLARNDLQREKEIKSILDSTVEEIKLNEIDRSESKEWNTRNTHLFEETQEEIRCHLLYQKFCTTTGEMDIKDFIRLCYDTELIPYDSININFTGKDAQHIFKKTVTKHFNPVTNTYREGVIHGKRILYQVFRLRILPEIAALKNMSINDLIVYLGNCSGRVRHHHHNDHKHGPKIISLLDQKHIDDKLRENTVNYGEHVDES